MERKWGQEMHLCAHATHALPPPWPVHSWGMSGLWQEMESWPLEMNSSCSSEMGLVATVPDSRKGLDWIPEPNTWVDNVMSGETDTALSVERCGGCGGCRGGDSHVCSGERVWLERKEEAVARRQKISGDG